jgi:hypothetical protein
MLYQRKVQNHANTRLTFESWKSQVTDAENPGNAQKSAKPKDEKQTQLRETRHSAEKTRPKLDVTRKDPTQFSSQKATPCASVVYLSLT